MPYKDPAQKRLHKKLWYRKWRETNREKLNTYAREAYRRKTGSTGRTWSHSKTPEERIDRIKVNRKRRYEAAMAYLLQYKSTHPCMRCGESDPCCLDCHHRDPSAKKDHVNKIAKNSIESLRIELEKCDVVCANCHRKLHHYGSLDLIPSIK